MKKVLIAYYSRTGTTRKIAALLKETLNCETEEIIDLKNRIGFSGNLSGGVDALLQRQTLIKQPAHDPSAYDLVILGTPVWFRTRDACPSLHFFALSQAREMSTPAKVF